VKADARADEQQRPTTSETRRRSGNRKRRVDCVEKRLPSDFPPRMMKAAHGLQATTSPEVAPRPMQSGRHDVMSDVNSERYDRCVENPQLASDNGRASVRTTGTIPDCDYVVRIEEGNTARLLRVCVNWENICADDYDDELDAARDDFVRHGALPGRDVECETTAILSTITEMASTTPEVGACVLRDDPSTKADIIAHDVEMFDDLGLLDCGDCVVHLELDQNVVPEQMPFRQDPIAPSYCAEADMRKMVDVDVIAPAEDMAVNEQLAALPTVDVELKLTAPPDIADGVPTRLRSLSTSIGEPSASCGSICKGRVDPLMAHPPQSKALEKIGIDIFKDPPSQQLGPSPAQLIYDRRSKANTDPATSHAASSSVNGRRPRTARTSARSIDAVAQSYRHVKPRRCRTRRVRGERPRGCRHKQQHAVAAVRSVTRTTDVRPPNANTSTDS